jgi:hypothetical protein
MKTTLTLQVHCCYAGYARDYHIEVPSTAAPHVEKAQKSARARFAADFNIPSGMAGFISAVA